VPIEPAARELLAALAGVLAPWGPWYVFGAQAVVAYEDMFLGRVRSIDIGGTTVPMLDVEDLVIAKVLAGRPKDIDDAQALWRVHGSRLDAGRIRRVLRDLENALSQSDLLPALDVVTGTAKRPSRD
jgi:uncharacterized nucleotidyltransferase DUF6036